MPWGSGAGAVGRQSKDLELLCWGTVDTRKYWSMTGFIKSENILVVVAGVDKRSSSDGGSVRGSSSLSRWFQGRIPQCGQGHSQALHSLRTGPQAIGQSGGYGRFGWRYRLQKQNHSILSWSGDVKHCRLVRSIEHCYNGVNYRLRCTTSGTRTATWRSCRGFSMRIASW